jgi:hypothetical protein
MKAAATLAALAIGAVVVADDVLYSSRLLKRGLLPNGNYNLCTSSQS